MSAGTGMFVSNAAHVKGWRSRSPAGTCRLYFLSRATKSTKKCPSCDLCRANGGRGRLKSRGAPAVESIHSQRPVPGASISLREDDAGPCGLRRCEAIKVCRLGTHRRWGARGRAYRAGGFIPPSEYSLKGSPTQTSGAFAVGNQSRFARMTQAPVACTGAKNALRLMRQRRTPGTHRRIDSAVSRTCAGKLHPERAKPDRGVSEYSER